MDIYDDPIAKALNLTPLSNSLLIAIEEEINLKDWKLVDLSTTKDLKLFIGKRFVGKFRGEFVSGVVEIPEDSLDQYEIALHFDKIIDENVYEFKL